MREDRNPPLRLPNLVSIAGAAKAEPLLRRALKQRNVTLVFEVPNGNLPARSKTGARDD